MSTPPPAKNLPLLMAAGVVILIVIAALVAVLTRPASAPLDPASPEGVVQSYSELALSDKSEQARALLTPQRADACRAVEPWDPERVRVTLVDEQVSGDLATVKVDVTETGRGSLFGGSEYTWAEQFTLERIDGAWRVSTAPWRVAVCEEIDDEAQK